MSRRTRPLRSVLAFTFALVGAACARPDAPVSPVSAAPVMPPDTIRVAVLGNSLAAGYGLARPSVEAFPALLQAACAAKGWPVRVVNHGVSGATSASGLAALDAVLRDSVDVLVLELGGNDALRGVPPQTLRRNLAEIMRRTQARYPDARLVLAGLSLPPVRGQSPYAAIYQGIVAAYRQAFAQAAQDAGAAFVPSLLEGVAGVRALNQPDYIHPTAEGQRRLFENLWPVLGPVIEEALGEGAVGRGL